MKLDAILKMTQPELKKNLFSELRLSGYKKVFQPNGFVYAAGSIPVLLIAHLDTVHRTPVNTICYSKDGNVLMSPEGIGGDDRAGVYMILEIIKEHKCHVLFCEDEERGAIGARKFTSSKHRPNVNYIIEFDRRGSNDAVFYNCDNRDFADFICGYGFKEEFGSFSDISIIAPHLGIAAVNISAGYYNEHNQHETIRMKDVENNINRAKQIVSAKTERYEYVEGFSYGITGFHGYGNVRRLDLRNSLFEEDETDENDQLFYDYFRSAKEK